MCGDLEVYFFFEKDFNLQTPLFVGDLHLSSHMTKKGSGDLKYALPQNIINSHRITCKVMSCKK